MQRTKLGISVGMMGAGIYFAGLFGGYIAVLFMVGYVLLFEENGWLKRSAIKATALLMIFSFITTIIGLIPSAVTVVDNILAIFNIGIGRGILNNIAYAVSGIISIIEKLLFLVLGVKALKQETIVIPSVEELISRHVV